MLLLNENMTRTSLWEELWVDVFKGFLVDDSAGAFLQDKMELLRSISGYIKESVIYYSLPIKPEFKTVYTSGVAETWSLQCSYFTE